MAGRGKLRLASAAHSNRIRQKKCMEGSFMKAFVAGCTAALVIALGAYFVLGSLGLDSGTVFSSPNVRLDG